jgi:hypothetical protein
MYLIMKKTILCLIFCFSLSPLSFAQKASFGTHIKDLSNEIMSEIYNDILKNQSDFPELKDFSIEALKKNRHGIYAIDFQYRAVDVRKKEINLGFGITIVREHDRDFKEYGENAFNYGFPLLGLKFAGYQKKGLRSDWFDINDVLQRYGLKLWGEQQKYLPFKLELETSKDEFKTGESIDFMVTVTNVSRRNLVVKDLNRNTLYFLYNGRKWGATTAAGGFQQQQNKVLKPKESIKQRFVGNGFFKAQVVDVYCSYVMTHEGVSPEGKLRINVVDGLKN